METEKQYVVSAQAKIAHTTYQTIITSGKHALVADEPEERNGLDTGITPTGLLLASLGSCTAITLRMYIEHKMWLVDEITVNLDFFNVSAGARIERQISFKGELNQIQKERLIEIANSCPIHKVLTGSIVIETNLKDK